MRILWGSLLLFLSVVFVLNPVVTVHTSDETSKDHLGGGRYEQEQKQDGGTNALTVPGSGPSITQEHREVLMRLHHIEKAYNLTQFNPDFDDMNHLEYFWHELSFLVKSNIPPTDERCYFNATAWRCFPVCQCAFQPKPGDYSLSRACRLSDDADRFEECMSDYHDEAWFDVFLDKLQDTVGQGVQKIRESIPDTDEACTYSFKYNRCLPEDKCSFQWRVGDVLPGRACRLRDVFMLEYDEELDDWFLLEEGDEEGEYDGDGSYVHDIDIDVDVDGIIDGEQGGDDVDVST